MSLAIAYKMKKKMAKGGSIEDAHEKQTGVNLPVHSGSGKAGSSMAGLLARDKKHSPIARGMHKDTLDELKAMPNPKLPMADGGEVCMACGGMGYSSGGVVDDLPQADFEPNQFDYLDEHNGEEGEEDAVSQVMKKRKRA